MKRKKINVGIEPSKQSSILCFDFGAIARARQFRLLDIDVQQVLDNSSKITRLFSLSRPKFSQDLQFRWTLELVGSSIFKFGGNFDRVHNV